MSERHWWSTEHLQVAIIALVILGAGRLSAQFDSGSSGANGPFPPAPLPDGTTGIVLNLQDGVVTFTPSGGNVTLPNVPDNGFLDGVLLFTTFDLPEGVTLRFLPASGNPPVDIRTQGDANVAGTIDVSGQNGVDEAVTGSGGLAGPGGFSGGLGQIRGAMNPGFGLGPGGGNQQGGGGGYATPGGNVPGTQTGGGPSYGTSLLRPLIGGSGGGGRDAQTSAQRGPTAGGGGGALGIASSATISLTGQIAALGGIGGEALFINSGAGGGAGGGIRLIANHIVGNGALRAAGGRGPGPDGGAGFIRLEAFDMSFLGSIDGVLTSGAPGPVTPTNAPRLRITAVDSTPVPENPNGSLRAADVFIDSGGTKTINVATNNVPVSTIVSVQAKPLGGLPIIGPMTGEVTGSFAAGETSVALTFSTPGSYFIEAQTVVGP